MRSSPPMWSCRLLHAGERGVGDARRPWLHGLCRHRHRFTGGTAELLGDGGRGWTVPCGRCGRARPTRCSPCATIPDAIGSTRVEAARQVHRAPWTAETSLLARWTQLDAALRPARSRLILPPHGRIDPGNRPAKNLRHHQPPRRGQNHADGKIPPVWWGHSNGRSGQVQ